ncbi:hypothetical protein GCM10028818_61800 [Spirosoma horti]
MTPFEEFEALGRIFKIIKGYRQQQADNLDPINGALVKEYMVKHLLSQDLQLWLRLERQDSLADFLHGANLDWSLKHLLCQFKRVAHGLSESWQQSHSLN